MAGFDSLWGWTEQLRALRTGTGSHLRSQASLGRLVPYQAPDHLGLITLTEPSPPHAHVGMATVENERVVSGVLPVG